MSRALVVGYRMAGQAVVEAWREHGDEAVAVDDRPSEADRRIAAQRHVELVVAPDPAILADLARAADLVVVSPGIPVGHPVYRAAAQAGTEVVSEIEFAWRVAETRAAAPTLVAITGTNGKTTVTTLVADSLVRSGLVAVAAGNIGVPLVEALTAEPAPDVVVAEVSSFQLEFTRRFHPTVSCWLNLAPDHLDWHPSHAHYRAAKARIWANQQAGDVAVINADDAEVVDAARSVPAGVDVVSFSTRERADWWEDGAVLRGPGEVELMAVDALARSLPHDRANALAAAAVAARVGGNLGGIRAALAEDRPLPHRVELIAESDGVAWYDDSKATTPASVVAAGRNKGLDLGALAVTVPPVHAVVAIGEAAMEVEAAFDGRVPVRVAASMAAAVEAAAAMSRPGDAVVLSPGCASFDWYRSYVARGDEFARLVGETVGKRRPGC
jgi:UDP-N-acetylmuramoylalanine--D-glutamate ligase